MTQNALRITSAGIAIAAVALISLAHDPSRAAAAATVDPSVPSASDVFHTSEPRSEGNVDDKTY